MVRFGRFLSSSWWHLTFRKKSIEPSVWPGENSVPPGNFIVLFLHLWNLPFTSYSPASGLTIGYRLSRWSLPCLERVWPLWFFYPISHPEPWFQLQYNYQIRTLSSSLSKQIDILTKLQKRKLFSNRSLSLLCLYTWLKKEFVT